MYRNLRQFLKTLEDAGELRRIGKPVSPHLEISRYTDRESKSTGGGKALFFENVAGSWFPVVTNMFGSPRRICMALGVRDLDELGARIRTYTDAPPPENLKAALGLFPMAFAATKFFPRTTRSRTPPCQQVVRKGRDADLNGIPALHCWPKDAGRFITLPLVVTQSAITGRRNVGMYRMQVYDRQTTGMHWHVHKDGSHYFGEYATLNRRMPVAVAIGADPATVYAATAPMPRGIDEMILAGFIRRKPVPMARCVTVDLEVPAEAEFVLEGYVDPGERRREGPFGDHTGYYSLADDYPVFHLTALTHRKQPVYATTLVGRPPMEDCYLAKATERIFLPLLQTIMPEIRDYWFPWEGVFHNIVVVSIHKSYRGHAQKVTSGLWGQGQMSFCKAVVAVDGDTDPADRSQLVNLLVDRLDTASDLTLTTGVLDVLDHASPDATFGGKIGIDLTRRVPGEPPRHRAVLPEPPADADLRMRVKQAVPATVDCRHLFRNAADGQRPANRVLAVSVKTPRGSAGRDLAKVLLAAENLRAFNIFLIFDADVDPADGSRMLWKLSNNVDPQRDLVLDGGRAAVDAGTKGPADGHFRQWPEELTFDV